MYNYVVTAHKPSKVSFTETGNFLSPTSHNLLVAKVNYIDVFSITPEGLVGAVELPIYGRITVMKLFRLPNEDQDRLLVLTEKNKVCVLRWNAQEEQCQTLAYGDATDHITPRTERIRVGIIDPQSRCIGLHQFQHLFKVLPTDHAVDNTEFNVRLVEDEILDIVFLHGCSKPTLAVLSKEGDISQLKTYEISMVDQDLTECEWGRADLDNTASHLIAVPEPIGGLLVVSYQSVVYLTRNGECINQPMDATMIKAIGQIDADGSRYLMGDYKGQLILLVLILDLSKRHVQSIELQPLGETSIASSISYLDNGYTYIGSDCGDSQLIKLEKTSNPETGSHIEIVQSYPHLGPITDFCIVKGVGYLRQGQGQVVACSGVAKDGSLRVIRNGIGISEQASVELPGIKHMFSLRRHIGDEYHSYLMQSFTSETRTLELIGAEEMAPTSLPALDESKPTLHAGNVAGDQIVQVTSDGVRLLDCGTMKGSSHPVWSPPGSVRVSVACGNASQLLLATPGGNLVYLEVDEKEKLVREVNHAKFENEIACVDCSALSDTKRVMGSDEMIIDDNASLAAVGLWADVNQSPVVKIVSLPSLATVYTVELGGDVMARSVLMATLEQSNYLLVALGDGYLLTYALDLAAAAEAANGKSQRPIVSERRKFNVGTQPANLSIFRSRGSNHVFAACDRPTVVYATPGVGKLLVSNVNLEAVTRVCGFHTESFPDCLAIAMENTLHLGAVDEIQKLHITAVPLHEQPRRIAHLESVRAFAVLTETTHFDDKGDEIVEYFVRLIHDTTYDSLHRYKLKKYELGFSLVSMSFEGEGIDSSIEYFVVGTALELPNEDNPKSGRILLFTVVDNKLVLVAEHTVPGATYSLSPFMGKLAAAVGSLVLVFSLKEGEDGSFVFAKEGLHHGHTLAYAVETRGHYIVVGDLMRSLTLLAWKAGAGGNHLEEIARDFDIAWTMSTEMLDDDTFILAEHTKNLITLRRNLMGDNEAERMRLDRVGRFHIGAMVNRIRHGSLVMHMSENESPAVKTLIFGTADGMLGVIATLTQDVYKFFYELQEAMVSVMPGVGGLKHADWREVYLEFGGRTFPANNYLDGDLIERFMDLPPEQMKKVGTLVGQGVEEIVRRVEEMQRLHGAG